MNNSRRGWTLKQSIDQSLHSSKLNNSYINKDHVIEEFLQMCARIANQDCEAIKNTNSKLQTIKKHYSQQKCRIEHQFKYIITLLEQHKKEMINNLTQHESELDCTFSNLQSELESIQSVILSIQNDILPNRNDIVEHLDDETFNTVLAQFEEQIQNAQQYKRELLSTKLNLIIVEEWSASHQESIKQLTQSSIIVKDYQKQLETPSELSASTCSDKQLSSRSSQEFRNNPMVISFDQRYFVTQNKSKELSQSLTQSEMVHDSCESDFLNEWVHQQ